MYLVTVQSDLSITRIFFSHAPSESKIKTMLSNKNLLSRHFQMAKSIKKIAWILKMAQAFYSNHLNCTAKLFNSNLCNGCAANVTVNC